MLLHIKGEPQNYGGMRAYLIRLALVGLVCIETSQTRLDLKSELCYYCWLLPSIYS
jgi:hypothetical protein